MGGHPTSTFSSIMISLAVVAAILSSSCFAMDCSGAKSTAITPFIGQWRNSEGDILTFRPGFWSSLRATKKAKKTAPWVGHLVAKDAVRDTADMVFDCQTLDGQGVARLLKDVEEEVAMQHTADEQAALSDLRASLIHPPYRVIDVTPYESRIIYILNGKNELLDLFLGEATFSMDRFSKVGKREGSE